MAPWPYVFLLVFRAFILGFDFLRGSQMGLHFLNLPLLSFILVFPRLTPFGLSGLPNTVSFQVAPNQKLPIARPTYSTALYCTVLFF